MSIYLFVEGDTEVLTLPRLLAGLYHSRRLRKPIALPGTLLIRDIGQEAAKVLFAEDGSHVFACPDLAPKVAFAGTRWAYDNYDGLQDVLRREVRRALAARLSSRRAAAACRRFHPHPFCHDFEVLLLAWPERLRHYLGTQADITRHFNSRAPEDQDFQDYPKRVVERLFLRLAHRAYDGTDDCPSFFDHCAEADVARIAAKCPRFRGFVTALHELAVS